MRYYTSQTDGEGDVDANGLGDNDFFRESISFVS